MLSAAAVAMTIVGCGGSSVGHGSGGSSVGNGNVTGGLSGPQTNLASLGYIETSYLTGQGRDLGDVVANISLGDWTDEFGNTASAPAGVSVNLQADAYGGPQVIRTPITFGTSSNPAIPSTANDSRLFRNYEFSINYLTTNLLPNTQIPTTQIFVNNGSMSADEQTADAISTTTFSPMSYPAYVRAFPGRFSSVTVRIDPNTIGLNFVQDTSNVFGPSNPRGIFETNEFNTINFQGLPTAQFTSVLSDYVSFDVSHMTTASRPSVSQNGVSVLAQRVFFSGDTYGIADGTNVGNFFQLTEDISSGGTAYIPGTFSTNATLAGYTIPSGAQAFLPGTYALTEIDPSDSSFLRKILSLEGIFSDYTKVIKSLSSVQAITFPSSQDNNVQDMVLFKTNSSGQIVDFYYGYMDYEANEFFLYPLNTLVNATPSQSSTSPQGYFHGKISAAKLYNASGAVATNGETTIRSGAFTLDNPLVWQDGTSTSVQTGTFIVYRH